MSLHGLQVSSEQACYAFAKKSDECFRATLKELVFPTVGKRFDHLENAEVLSFDRPKRLFALQAPKRYFSLGLIQ